MGSFLGGGYSAESSQSRKKDAAANRRMMLQEMDLNYPSNVVVNEEYVAMPDGHVLFTRCYIPNDMNNHPKGMICFNIGYGSHCNMSSIHDFALEWCSKRGFIFFTHEHFGHGRSDGLYLYVPDFSQLVRHSSYLHKRAKIHHSKLYNIPSNGYFIIGMSLGGAVTIHQSLYESEIASKEDEMIPEWNGMILSAPMCGIDDAVKPPKWVEYLVRYLILPLVPTLQQTPSQDLEPLLLSENAPNASHNKVFDGDVLPPKEKPRIATAASFVDACEFIEKNANRVTMPMILIHSKEDKVTSAKASKQFVENTSSKEKVIKLYEKGYHLIWDDCTKDAAYRDVEQWIQTRMMN